MSSKKRLLEILKTCEEQPETLWPSETVLALVTYVLENEERKRVLFPPYEDSEDEEEEAEEDSPGEETPEEEEENLFPLFRSDVDEICEVAQGAYSHFGAETVVDLCRFGQQADDARRRAEQMLRTEVGHNVPGDWMFHREGCSGPLPRRFAWAHWTSPTLHADVVRHPEGFWFISLHENQAREDQTFDFAYQAIEWATALRRAS